MNDVDTSTNRHAPDGGTTLTITGFPSLDGDGSFINEVADRVLTNTDAEFSEANIRALLMVAKGLLLTRSR